MVWLNFAEMMFLLIYALRVLDAGHANGVPNAVEPAGVETCARARRSGRTVAVTAGASENYRFTNLCMA